MRVSLPVLSLFVASGFFGFTTVPVSSAESCKVVARVLESSGNLVKFGTGLCINQGISYPKPVRVGCVIGQGILWVKKSIDLSACNEQLNTTRPYSPSSRQPLDRMRSRFAQSKPMILRPYGDTLMQSPKELTWKPVGGVDSYSVTILGNQTQRFLVVQPQLSLPPILNTSSIQFLIEAFAGGKLVSSSATTFTLLSFNEAQKVKKDLASIEQIKLPLQEKNALQLSVLSNSELVDDSVMLLQKQVKLQPKNPYLVRLMADVFLQAGLYDDASTAYTETKRMAASLGDQKELKRAEYGLSLIASLIRQAAS
jgi:hypothetical protein